MAINPWLAIDATTPRRLRANQLRRSWESFVAAREPAAMPGRTAPRQPITASWRRSLRAGVDPFLEGGAPCVADEAEISARWEGHPLSAAVPLLEQCVGIVASEAQHLVVVSDAEGVLLWIDGDRRLRLAAADMMNFAEGATWNEASTGTNGIGTALAAQHPVQVFAAEHYNEAAQAWSCAGAPIRDPETEELLGVINISNLMTTAHPHNFTCAVATAQAIEAHLRCTTQERDARLRARYDQMLPGRHRVALVSTSGRVLSEGPSAWLGTERVAVQELSGELVLPSGVRAHAEPLGDGQGYRLHAADDPHPRARRHLTLRVLGQDRATVKLRHRTIRLTHRATEVLTLLASHPSGMTTEQLAVDLYGDAGQPGAARVQVSRLRKALGGGVETEPYRLEIEIDSDSSRVGNLLDRGAVREAAEQYRGPLLPRSEAPGIVRDREALESWLRHAVMTAEDHEALWAWVQCPSGHDDLPAWKRLLAQLDFDDPRRSLAATHVQSLRAMYSARS
jgi:hypothetical protein